MNEIIALDVPAYVQLTKLKQILYVLIYQLFLIVGFLLGGFPGRLITQGMCKFMKYQPKYFN